MRLWFMQERIPKTDWSANSIIINLDIPEANKLEETIEKFHNLYGEEPVTGKILSELKHALRI